jgi:hypothetical protein
MGLRTGRSKKSDKFRLFQQPARATRLEESYRPIMALQLETITRSHLAQEFRKTYRSKEETTRKQLTFFIHAARDAGKRLSKRIDRPVRSSRRRSIPATKRMGVDAATPPTGLNQPDSSADRESTKSIKFKGGGTVTLSFTVNLLKLQRADREFVNGLIDLLDEYESNEARSLGSMAAKDGE